MRPSAISIVAILATLACRQAEPAPIDDKGATALAPDAVFADDSLGWIVEIGLVGDRVVALDAMLQPAIHVVDLETSRRLGSYGHQGDGPGEFKDPEQVVAGASNSPDEVWILDGVHQRLTRLSLHEIEAGNRAQPGNISHGRSERWSAGFAPPTGRGSPEGGSREVESSRYHADRSYDRTIVGFPPDVSGGAGNDASAGVRELGGGRSGGRASGGSDASGRTARDLRP